MKKGFTLAEVLIVVAIIATIMTVVLPIINRSRPDENAIKYRSAFYGFERAVGNLTNGTGYTAGNLAQPTDSKKTTLCNNLMAEFSTIGIQCATNGTPDDNRYDAFTTSNNMVFYIPRQFSQSEPTGEDEKYMTVCVDVNGNGTDEDGLPNTGCLNNQNELSKDQFRIQLDHDGRVYTPPEWTVENDVLKHSTKIRK